MIRSKSGLQQCLRIRVLCKNDFQSRLLLSRFLQKKNLKTTSSVKRAELVFCGAFSIFFGKNDFEEDDFEFLKKNPKSQTLYLIQKKKKLKKIPMHRDVGMEKLISVLLSYYTSKMVTDSNWDTVKNFFYPSWCPQPVYSAQILLAVASKCC